MQGAGSTGSDCTPGAAGCPCVDNECLSSLVCDPDSELCFSADCTPGVFECPCREDQTCDPALTCVGGSCVVDDAGTGSSTVSGVSSGPTSTGMPVTTVDPGSTTQSSSTSASSGTTESSPAFPDGAVIMFYGGQLPDGDISAQAGNDQTAENLRSHVDAQCAAQEIFSTLPCQEHAALITVGLSDTIAGIAERAEAVASGPLVGPTAMSIAPSFSAALDTGAGTPLTTTLANAQVYDAATLGDLFFTGTLQGGLLSGSLACGGWAPMGAGINASAGNASVTDRSWVGGASVLSCDNEGPLLCVCW